MSKPNNGDKLKEELLANILKAAIEGLERIIKKAAEELDKKEQEDDE